jgi:zinc ribbon protein
MFCARCGQQLPDASQTCPHCGQPVNWAWQPSPPPPPPGQPASAAPASHFFPVPAPAAHALEGVSGALLFFCICLTILWPLWILSQYALFSFRLTAWSALVILRLIFGIVAGITLWVRQAAAMVLLRIYLILGAGLTLFNLFSMFQFALRYRFSALFGWRVLMSTGSSLLFLGSLILYFSLSERVRNTYGSKLFG